MKTLVGEIHVAFRVACTTRRHCVAEVDSDEMFILGLDSLIRKNRREVHVNSRALDGLTADFFLSVGSDGDQMTCFEKCLWHELSF